MSWLLVVGITVTLGGALWGLHEHNHPDYWVEWGLSKRTADIIGILTTCLFPGGYLVILLAPGYGWWFKLGVLLATHFIGVQILCGTVYGVAEGLRAKRRFQQALAEAKQGSVEPPDAHEHGEHGQP